MARNFNYTKINWQDGTILQPAKVNVQGTEYEVESAVISGQTPLNSTNLDHMDEAIETIIEEELPNVINVELLAIEDTAPSECSTGDKYYNTTDKKIYTATGENTWSSTGEDPLDGILYVLFDKRNTFAWNGTDLISVGGGGGVYIGTTPPEDDNVNYWINPDDNIPVIEDFATVLWTNSSPLSEFAAQSITLSDSIANYKYYEIIYRHGTWTTKHSSTGKIPSNFDTELRYQSSYLFKRPVANISGTSVEFNDAIYYATYGNSTETTSNAMVIPYQILGYK